MDLEVQNTRPSVYDYEDYRNFLRDLYDYYKKTTTHFSYRYFSKKAGLSSPNYLKLVMNGERNLSHDGALAFAKGLKLSKQETDFFVKLVEYCQLENSPQKSQAARQLIKSKTFQKTKPLKLAELNYYAKWYYIPIRELVGLKSFKEDPAWVARQIQPSIKEQEAAKALKDLERIGLLGRDPDGNLVQVNENVQTAGEVKSLLVADYHREMIRLGSESISRFDRTEREISGTCVSCSEETIQKIKNMVREFRKEILAVASEDSNSDRICQLNFQLFPVSKLNEDEK